MTKISHGQLICMTLCVCAFGVFSGTSGYSPDMIRGIALSSLIKLIPIGIIVAYEKMGIEFGKITNLLFAIFFIIFGAQLMISLFGAAGSVSILPDNHLIGVGVLIAAAIYCASLGLRANARATVPVIIILVIACGILILGSRRHINIDNLYSSQGNGIYCSAVEDFWSSGELVILLYLSRYCKNASHGILGSFASITVMRGGICILGTAVLGKLASITNYPFFLLGAYSQPFSVQRTDWLYLVLYVFVAVMSIAIQIMLAAHILREIFPKIKHVTLLCSAVLLLLATSSYNMGISLFPLCGALIILMTVAIPSIYFLKEMIRNKTEA